MSTPEEQGMDSAQLLAALDYVETNGLPIDSITVIRHGYVVLDAYYAPYTAGMKHHLWSATEGVMSALVGIAVDQGLIDGLDQPLLALFPDRTVANRTANKEALTLGNLLSMSSGIACENVMPSILQAPDTLEALLDLNVPVRPGIFTHCPQNSDLLSGAVETAAGTPLLDFANEYLFSPLGISDYQWQTFPDGLVFGELGLHLTPHDMARLGYLYLHGGQWADEQVVSSAWVDTATCADPAQCPFDNVVASTLAGGGQFGYGYHWWVFPGFYITGIIGSLGGQLIAVAPEQDMVVVLTSRTKEVQEDAGAIPSELIGNLIIGAASAAGPLPANPDALAALETRVEALGNPQPLAVEPLPAKAAQISGVSYALNPSIHLWFLDRPLGEHLYGWPLQVDAFTLTFDQPDEATLDLDFSDGYAMALAVGLDGVRRVTDTRLGPVAMTGQWAPTGQGFAMNFELVGTGEQRQLSFGALGNTVLFICQNLATGYIPDQPASTAAPRE
jgi:CubicO group peptidase (beta-lactamase class C family)